MFFYYVTNALQMKIILDACTSFVVYLFHTKKEKNMKTLLIKSNQGNHSGFNVKYTLLEVCDNLKEAKKELIKASFDLSDDHVIRNGRAFDTNSKRYICVNSDTSFTYDGYTYMLINKNDLDLFNMGSYGYLPNEIINQLIND